jgi:hypothetical protein
MKWNEISKHILGVAVSTISLFQCEMLRGRWESRHEGIILAKDYFLESTVGNIEKCSCIGLRNLNAESLINVL